jgi:hypothetical protein
MRRNLCSARSLLRPLTLRKVVIQIIKVSIEVHSKTARLAVGVQTPTIQ